MKTQFRHVLATTLSIQLAFGPMVSSISFAAGSADAAVNTATSITNNAYGTTKPSASFDQRPALKPTKPPTIIFDLDNGKKAEGSAAEIAIAKSNKTKDKSGKVTEADEEVLAKTTKISELTDDEMERIYREQSPAKVREKLLQFMQKPSNYLLLGPNGQPLAMNDGSPQGQAMAAHQQAQLDAYAQKSLGQKVAHGSIHFANETLSFAVANAIINTVILSQLYSTNPVAYEQALQSLKDPWGHIGFYGFMVANGFAGDLLNEIGDKTFRANHPAIWKAWSKTIVPQLSMTAGSLASQMIGDFGQTMKACGWKTLGITPPTNLRKNLKLASAADKKAEGSQQQQQQEDPCEIAWKQWTIEKKSIQYMPSILSMLASNVASIGVMKAIGAVKAKAADTALFKAISTKGANVMLALAGGPAAGGGRKFAVRSIEWLAAKSSAFSGKVINFAMFTGLDMAMHGWIADKTGNWLRGHKGVFGDNVVQSFTTKAEKLKSAIEKERKSGWESSEALKVTDDFVDSMNAWKEFNQSHPMTSYYNWTQKINNLINVERLSFHFYEQFLNDIQSDIAEAKAIKNAGALQQNVSKALESSEDNLDAALDAMSAETNNATDIVHQSIVSKLFPLFGVKPSATSKMTNADYINRPEDLEKDQSATVRVAAAALEKVVNENKANFAAGEYQKLLPLIKSLKSTNARKQGAALYKIQKDLMKSSDNEFSRDARNYLRKLYEMLGYPKPLFLYGNAYAEAFTAGVEAGALDTDKVRLSGFLESAQVPYWFGPYTRYTSAINFNPELDKKKSLQPSNKLDYLVYNMICGARDSKGIISEDWGNSDAFVAPRLIKSELNLDICNYKLTRFRQAINLYADQMNDLNSTLKFKGAWNVILPNLKPDIRKMVNSSLDQENSRFTVWWKNLTDKKLEILFDKYQKDFDHVAVELAKTYYRADSSLNDGTIRNAWVFSWMQQTRIVSLLLGEMYKDLSAQTKSLKVSEFMEEKALGSRAAYKMSKAQDLFLAQMKPYNSEFSALSKGTPSRVLKFQYDVEQMITSFNAMAMKVKVEEANGKEAVKAGYSQEEFAVYQDKVKKVSESVQATVEELGKRTKLSAKQQKLVSLLAKNLMVLAQEPETQLNYFKLTDRSKDDAKDALKGKCQKSKGGAGARAGQVGDCQ